MTNNRFQKISRSKHEKENPVADKDEAVVGSTFQKTKEQYKKITNGNLDEREKLKNELQQTEIKLKNEKEMLKTAIAATTDELDYLNILEIILLIFVSILHSFVLLTVASLFLLYQCFVGIYYLLKYCYEHPIQAQYGFQTLKYAYQNEWWTFSGVFRYWIEPPPPPIFQQRTINGEVIADPNDIERLAELTRKTVFHQKNLNGEYKVYSSQIQNLELLKKNSS